MPDDASVRYSIDGSDRIILVDESWYRFAHENGGDEVVDSKVIGRSLWDFIADDSTRALYRQILARVRRGQLAQFTLRCDGPSCRRLLEMSIEAGENGTVHFSTKTLRSTERERMPLLERDSARSDATLRSCAWCNRIYMGPGEWVEVEEATERLSLFEGARLPMMSHGICEDCMVTMSAALDQLESSVP